MRDRKRGFLLLVALLAMMVLSGCNQRAAPAETGETGNQDREISSVEDVVSALEAEGVSAEVAGGIEQVFFPVSGQIVTVNGQDVQLFQFQDEAAAESAAGTVDASGSAIGTTMVTWVGPPHFFRAGPVIALYVGSNEEVLAALNGVFGAQFAGR